MKSIAVIGLGIMGHGIADNFLKNGYKVFVWNRSPEKADDLLKNGAVLSSSVKEAIESADLIFEVTANDESSKLVWLGKNGIIENAKPNQSLITCATLSVGWTDELAQRCESSGLSFFDMPMTGGRSGAESGQLVLLAGGDETKLNDLDQDLKAIAAEVKLFGKAGFGMRYKLILNAVQAMHIAAFGEAMKLAREAGLDEKVVGDALAVRPGGTTTNLTWRDYQNAPDPINFSVEWISKDLDYAAKMAKSTEHPLLDEAQKQYKNAIDKGFSQADWTKITKL